MTYDAPIPFDEAIAIAQRKGILPTSLTSAQLSNLSAQLKRRADFSARMDKASVLQVLQDQITKIVSNEGIAEEGGRLRSAPEAKSRLREALVAAGVPFAEPGTPAIRDFYSDKRRSLMIETNLLDVLGAGRHIAGNDPVALEVNPGLELIRMIVPKGGVAAERDWPARWTAALDTLGEDDAAGCTDGGDRMVALKNNPIWQALGDGAGGYEDTLGNPWPPFAFNSGMNTMVVSREDCVDLGILEEDETPERDDSIDINENLEASAARFSGALQAELARTAGLKLLDGVLRLVGNRAAILNSNPNHDSLGRFATAPGVLTERDNIRRGRRAIARVLRTRRTVRDAMMVKGLGTVHFAWGRPGTNQRNVQGASHYDGYGISHIVAKRGEDAARKLPVVLARGKVGPQGADASKRLVQHQGWSAVLRRTNATNSFVVTHIDDDVAAKKSGRLPGGQSALDKVGNRVGTPCPTLPPLLFAKGTEVALNTVTIGQARARLKPILELLEEAA